MAAKKRTTQKARVKKAQTTKASAKQSPRALSEPLNVEDLPRWAACAFAARCAWRVMPVLVEQESETPFAYWGERAVEHLGSLDTAIGVAASAGLTGGRFRAVDAAAVYAADTYGAARAARATVTAARTTAVRAARAARHAADAAVAAAYTAARTARAAARAAAAADLLLLTQILEDSAESKDSNPAIDERFFQRPLWEGADEKFQSEWQGRVERFIQALSKLGLEGMAEAYQQLHDGRGFDLEATQMRIAAWEQARQRDDGEDVGAKQQGESVSSADPIESSVDSKEEPTGDEEPVVSAPQALTIPSAKGDAPALKDHLGREPLVDTLAAMCSSPKQGTPFTIALVGKWGDGKSSVMAQLQSQLHRVTLRQSLWAVSKAGWESRFERNRLAEIQRCEGEGNPVKPGSYAAGHVRFVAWRKTFKQWLGLLLSKPSGKKDEQGRPIKAPGLLSKAWEDWRFRHRFDLAWFNAWQYERAKDITAGLGEEVIRAMDN